MGEGLNLLYDLLDTLHPRTRAHTPYAEAGGDWTEAANAYPKQAAEGHARAGTEPINHGT